MLFAYLVMKRHSFVCSFYRNQVFSIETVFFVFFSTRKAFDLRLSKPETWPHEA
jgi:hypothetical protein